MRKLATVRTVAAINPIIGADAIECALIDGWSVVVKRGEFKPGDACVYFEIDSVLPVKPEFEFLRKSSYVKRDWVEGFRLRTVKLRGQVSQGLAIPLALIPEAKAAFDDRDATAEGSDRFDVTDLLGVQKWEPPIPAQLAGLVKGQFPSFIPKTDQERCQNLVAEILETNRITRWEVTTKLDGSSMTVYVNGDDAGVCSRNFDLKLEDTSNSFVGTAVRMRLHDALKSLRENVALQGELMGPGIQGNREGLNRTEFFVFDVYDIDSGCYLAPSQRQALVLQIAQAQRRLGVDEADLLKHVPVLHNFTSLGDLQIDTLDGLLAFADGPSLVAPIREGVVFKRFDGRFSFKAISNQFLLKQED